MHLVFYNFKSQLFQCRVDHVKVTDVIEHKTILTGFILEASF